MKVTLPEKQKINKKELIIYVSITAFCILAIIIAFYVQFYARIDIGKMLNIVPEGKIGNKTEEEINIIKTEFDKIYTNDFEDNNEQNNKKKDKEKSLIYTNVEKKETKLNCYDLEVHIPYINIDNKIIEKYNKEIEDFVKKTEEVLNSENKNIIYTVEYVANVYNDILSLMICSNLKEGSSAQRVIIQTYNYDLRNNKEISLAEVLDIEKLNEREIQEQIKNNIEIEQKKVEDLRKLGYNIYNRDTTSQIYDIENSKEFYLTEDTLYIIYAYGNDSFTSEKDLIII